MTTLNNNKNTFSGTRENAVIAGSALLLMAVVAIFSYGFVQNTLVVENDAVTTFRNLQSAKNLFLAGVSGWVLIFVLDALVAWTLYLFFRAQNQRTSMLTAVLRLVYTAVLGLAILHFIPVVKLLDNSETVVVAETIMHHFESFEKIWSLGLIIFGFHLLLLGFLALKSKTIPQIFGFLLVAAAVIYVFIHSAKQLFPIHEAQIVAIETWLSLPMAAGEIGFAFWLVVRGGKPVKEKILYKANSPKLIV